jgi:hypothetical protein
MRIALLTMTLMMLLHVREAARMHQQRVMLHVSQSHNLPRPPFAKLGVLKDYKPQISGTKVLQTLLPFSSLCATRHNCLFLIFMQECGSEGRGGDMEERAGG